MSFFQRLFVATLALAGSAIAAPRYTHDRRDVVERDGTVYNVFEHAATGAKLEFVKNSGICETTPGVNQYSGYLSVGTNMNMWFWFFEARTNATTAPLATWFNGGPGCSSMVSQLRAVRRLLWLCVADKANNFVDRTVPGKRPLSFCQWCFNPIPQSKLMEQLRQHALHRSAYWGWLFVWH